MPDPKKILLWLLCILIACAIGFAFPYAWYGWPTARSLKEAAHYLPEGAHATKDMMVHGDKAVGEGARAAQKSVTVSEDTDKAVKHLDDTLTKVDTLIKSGAGTLRAATGTLNQSTKLIATVDDGVKKAAPAAAETKRLVDQIIDAWATMPPHLNQMADNSAELIDSLNSFAADRRTAELREAFTAELLSLKAFTDRGTVLEGDVHNYIKPYDGNHPKWHATSQITQGLLGISVKGASGLYYGIGAKKGQ